jgi:pentatricopeptide repeat protein
VPGSLSVMVATLTSAAARRVFHCRGALFLRSHAGASAVIAENLSFKSSDIINAHRNSTILSCRTFSSDPIEPYSPPSSYSARGPYTHDNISDSPSTNETPMISNDSNEINSPTTKKVLLPTPTLTEEEYDPEEIVSQIFIAAKWNQGRSHGGSRKWDYEFVRTTLDKYELHLRFVLDRLKSKGSRQPSQLSPSATSSADLLSNIHPSAEKCAATHKLLSPKTLANAIRSLTRSKMDTPLLSKRIREIERLVGLIGWTSITEELSYRLLEANGKAGNVTRTLALLELRKRRRYDPREQDDRTFSIVDKAGILKLVEAHEELQSDETAPVPIERGEKEFIHAITAIQSAQLPLRRSRNLYLHESSFTESALDNPTRYLDAILLNMSQRGVPLRPEMATQMLACYASTGRTGRALHYFYKVIRDPVEEDGYYIPGPHPTHLSRAELEEWKLSKRQEGRGRIVAKGYHDHDAQLDVMDESDEDANDMQNVTPQHSTNRTKPRMIMHPPPPFHKIPSNVKDSSLARSYGHKPFSFVGTPKSATASPPSSLSQPTSVKSIKTKLDWEVDHEWSLSLTAAFAFADSLTHGACGHEPIELDVGAWNCLLKACCYRGALHRALNILDKTMPQKGIDPDIYSYNTILAGLARVGDIATLKEYLVRMTNKRVPIDKYTVQAIADGLLNVGDISGASTMVQDIFNQHNTLPPYTTHLKIIEFALSNGLIFEAKRHVYFIQQLWKWQPSPHDEKRFRDVMNATKHNPKLSKEALQKLFRYFSEELQDEDFF